MSYYFQESFSKPYYVYGLQLQVAATNTPVNITIEIEFKAEACSSSLITNNETITQVLHHLSLVVRNPVFGVSDQIRQKPDCTIKEDGYMLEISGIESRGIVLSV